MTPKDKVLIDLIKICTRNGLNMGDMYELIVNRNDISPQTKRNQIKLYNKIAEYFENTLCQ